MSLNIRSDLLELADWDWSPKAQPVSSTAEPLEVIKIHEIIAVEEKISAVHEEVFAVRENIPAVYENVSAIREEVFAVQEDIPAVHGKISAVHEDTPCKSSQVENQRPRITPLPRLHLSPKELSPVLPSPKEPFPVLFSPKALCPVFVRPKELSPVFCSHKELSPVFCSPKKLSPALFSPPPLSPPPRPSLQPFNATACVDPYDIAVAQAKEFTITFFPDYAKKEKIKAEMDPDIRRLVQKHKSAKWADEAISSPQKSADGQRRRDGHNDIEQNTKPGQPSVQISTQQRRGSGSEKHHEFGTGSQLGSLYESIKKSSRRSTLVKNEASPGSGASSIDEHNTAAKTGGSITSQTEEASKNNLDYLSEEVKEAKAPLKAETVEHAPKLMGGSGTDVIPFPVSDENTAIQKQAIAQGAVDKITNWVSTREASKPVANASNIIKYTIDKAANPSNASPSAFQSVGNAAQYGQSSLSQHAGTQNKSFAHQFGTPIHAANSEFVFGEPKGYIWHVHVGNEDAKSPLPDLDDANSWPALPLAKRKSSVTSSVTSSSEDTVTPASPEVELAQAMAQEFCRTFMPDYARKRKFTGFVKLEFRAIISKHKAEKWVQPLRQVPLQTIRDDLSKDMSPRNLCVAGFMRSVREGNIRHWFAHYGYVEKVQFIHNKYGVRMNAAYVRFEKESDASRAMENLNGMERKDVYFAIKRARDVADWTKEEIEDMSPSDQEMY